MHRAVICINPVMPDAIGFTTGAGLPGDVRCYFKTIAGVPYPNVAALYPQLVLRPFTAGGASAYDITIDDPVGAAGTAVIPGSVMNDRFNVEVYTRNDQGQPQDMIACGRIDLTGYAYQASGPLAPATYSTGPAGPAGPAGAPGAAGTPGVQGTRGSRWYTGTGAPATVPDTRIEGDMYLDGSSGDVWRWSSGTGTWMAFKGISP